MLSAAAIKAPVRVHAALAEPVVISKTFAARARHDGNYQFGVRPVLEMEDLLCGRGVCHGVVSVNFIHTSHAVCAAVVLYSNE